MATTTTPRVVYVPVRATVTCKWCGWAAQLSGETVEEVGTFLRQQLLLHVRERHPDQVEHA